MSTSQTPSGLKHGDITDKVIRCFYDVYNELGFGFLESVYHRAMVIALESVGLFVESRVKLPVYFRGQPVGEFEADLFIERLVILELKAVEALLAAHEAQLLNYLKATDAEVGITPQLRAEAQVHPLPVRQRAEAIPPADHTI